MIKAIRPVLLMMLSAFVSFAAHAAQDKQEAQALVEKAAAYAKANGKDKLLIEVGKKDGSLRQGELYVFVSDTDGTLIAHPTNPGLIGKNEVSKPDAEGKFFRKEILNVANSQGSGWVDYKSLNPASGKPEPKSAYVRKQGDIIIGTTVSAK